MNNIVLQVSFISETIDLPQGLVEKKLSQMILDSKLTGVWSIVIASCYYINILVTFKKKILHIRLLLK